MNSTKIIVPAKGNSLRLPKKNLKKFGSFPLLHWTLEPLIESQIGEVIVSSESSEVLDFASNYNVKIHRRPENLSLPNVHSSRVVLDVARKICNSDDYIGVALPTLPFRKKNTLKSIEETFLNDVKRSLITVVSMRISRNHILFKNNGGYSRISEEINFQDNDSPEVYAFSGYLQLAKLKDFDKKKSFHLINPNFFEVPFDEALDINTYHDFKFAKRLIRN